MCFTFQDSVMSVSDLTEDSSLRALPSRIEGMVSLIFWKTPLLLLQSEAIRDSKYSQKSLPEDQRHPSLYPGLQIQKSRGLLESSRRLRTHIPLVISINLHFLVPERDFQSVPLDLYSNISCFSPVAVFFNNVTSIIM